MSNERAKFEEWAKPRCEDWALEMDDAPYGEYNSAGVQGEWEAWQASRVAALEEACKAVDATIGGGRKYDVMRAIRSLAEAPTKEK